MQIFLDDVRDSYSDSWTIARNVDDFKNLVLSNSITAISFDHDLGERMGIELPSGYDAARWFIDRTCDEPSLAEKLQYVIVHSSNPPGAENIFRLFENAQKHGLIPSDAHIHRWPYQSRK